MVTRRIALRVRPGLAATLAVLSLSLLPRTPVARADFDDRPFDFADAFYRANGVDPDRVVNRRTGSDGLSVVDEAPDATRRDVRVTITIPAYDHSGHIRYWNVFGEFFVDGFTPDLAGQQARSLADASPIFVFPKRSGEPLALGNNRQADLIDLRNGYFSNNSLGLWVIVFVNYTDRALTTRAGQRAIDALAGRNGRDFDGTAIIKTIGDIDDLLKDGFVTTQTRPLDGSQGPIWSICPVIEDPRGGAIAPDAFLVTVRRPDGTPLPAEQAFVDEFTCLQTSGDWCN